MIEALKHSDIVDLFLGDKKIRSLEDEKFIEGVFSMPYLRHVDLNGLASLFNIKDDVRELDMNRVDKMQWIIDKVIANGQEEKFLNYFFSSQRYITNYLNDFEYNSQKELNNAVENEVESYIRFLNSILYFSNKILIRCDGKSTINDIDDSAKVMHDIETHINHNYIKELPNRISNNLESSNYDSVITQCRTMIEEVNIHILENENVDFSHTKGNINKLNTLVSETLNMKSNKDYDNRINDLLNGLNKINNAIANMRNNYSDSHGVGKSRVKIGKREARLIMNSTITYCDYLLDVYEDTIKVKKF